MRTSLYVRLDLDKHRRLSAYAKAHELTLNDAVERMVDQVLAQTYPDFEWPEWLTAAVKAGHLPFELPESYPSAEDGEYEERRRTALRAV